MSADLTASDLRRLADALDALAAMSAQTGVTVQSYTEDEVTINDHIIRIRWREADGDEPGHYLAEWPDRN